MTWCQIGAKPLPEPMLANHLLAISQDMFKILIFDIYLKITDLRLQLHIPGDNGFF